MITKHGSIQNGVAWEVYGLSTDEKPIDVPNGSVFYEIDTSKEYRFDGEGSQWYESASGGGGTNVEIESLSVSENGTYTADEGKAYSPVEVNVPNTYTLGDAGKVVRRVDGTYQLVAQDTKVDITVNGYFDTTYYAHVDVQVPHPTKFWGAIYSGDVLTDIYINTDQSTPNYKQSMLLIFQYYQTNKMIFDELRFRLKDTTTVELRQGDTVIASVTTNGAIIQGVVWNTDHVTLTNPFTADLDGGGGTDLITGAMMKIFSKAPLFYGHTASE